MNYSQLRKRYPDDFVSFNLIKFACTSSEYLEQPPNKNNVHVDMILKWPQYTVCEIVDILLKQQKSKLQE